MAPSGLTAVRARLEAAAARSGRDPAAVTLVAVTKGRSPDEIMRVYDEGHRVFGENRPEELAAKAPQLPGDISWHMVGTVQSRKAALAAPHTTLLHSLDRERLARRWADLGGSPALVQVNIAEEPQKHGVAPDGVDALVSRSIELGLVIRGLMVIPPQPVAAEDSRVWFDALRDLRDGLRAAHPGIEALSMGMTDDYEVAVEAGASLIRVGRAIFEQGPRAT